jgi:hypothetical protein
VKAPRFAVAGLVVGVLAAGVPAARANDVDPFRVVPWTTSLQASADGGVTQRVSVPGAVWLRLVFGGVSLGEGSYVRLRSLRDGGEQTLDAAAMERWSNATAVFNGGEVEVKLVAGEEDTAATLTIKAVLAGEPPQFSPQTICGVDDRLGTLDNRMGRIRPGGCTAWRIGNGAMLTAGHCVDFDPDNSGPILPDGVVDLSGVVEFNVPDSQSDGTLVASAPQDQFPVNAAGVQWRFDGEGQGLGKDWGVFRVNANANGFLPHQTYGAPLRITAVTPSNGTATRITGFGTDDGVDNQTEQTHAGPFAGLGSSGSDIWVSYATDTEGGNSGSPVMWDAISTAFGIHTNGGCTSTGGSNVGTSFQVIALQNAINAFPGPSTVHVDVGHPTPGAGSLTSPRASLSHAMSSVPVGGIVSVYPGSYAITIGTIITRAQTVQAPTGLVTITGN